MRLTDNMRSTLAEKICREWIKKRHIKLAAPKVYVIWRKFECHFNVWGVCYPFQRRITLNLPKYSNPSEWIILLAHEFSHYLDYWTTPKGKWRRERRPHGERFQMIFWRTLSRHQWPRAASGHWLLRSSRHRPEFQP